MTTITHARRARARFATVATLAAVLAGLLGGLVGAVPVVEAQTATATRTPTPTPTATPTRTRTATPTPTITATPALERVAMAPLTARRQVGQFQNFAVTAHFSDGSTKNFTQKVIYSSSNLNVVFPPNIENNAGRVEAVGIGIATISVTEPTTGVNSNASNESAVMEVVEAPTPTPTRTGSTPTPTRSPTPTPTATPRLTVLTLSPATAKRNVGQFQNFSVSGTFSDGSQKNMTQLVNYASSNTAVASTPNTLNNKGKVDAVGPGVATISATDPITGVSTTTSGGNAVFTVVTSPTPTTTRTGATPTRTLSPTPTVSPTPVVVSIAIAPLTVTRPVGGSQNFTCRATMSDATEKNFTQRCKYISSDPAVAFAPNDTAGNKGRVNAVGPGIATISALDEATGIATTQNATFTVEVAPTPSPTNTGVTPTRTRTPTPTPTATPKLVSLVLSPATAKRAAGSFQNFSVNGTYSDGSQKNLTQKVDYTSSDPAVAFAANETTPGSNKGRVYSIAAGVATISARDPLTGVVTSTSGGNAVFTVTEPPTPTPTRTGPTSTAPTGTPTFTPPPVPTATPVLTSISLSPKTAQKPIGSPQNFTATGTFSNGDTRNVTQRLVYTASDPTIAEARNESGNAGRVWAVKVGVVTIAATDPTSGVATTAEGGATFTVVQGSGSPNPRVTATPVLPVQTGNPTTICQKDLRRAARAFVDKKLKVLDRCGSAASRCVQKKPNDPECLGSVRGRCARALTKVADDEAKFIASVIRRCAALNNTDILGQDGLAFGQVAPSCAARFGRTLTDLTSVAQCLAAQHACRAETLLSLQRPRTGELLRLLDAAPDAGECRADFGGAGIGVGDPKGVGKLLERCVQTLVKRGATLARTRLGALGRCTDDVFTCVEALPGDAACLTRASQKCDREFAKVQKVVGATTVATTKACTGIDFGVLRAATGAYLDAVIPNCPHYGIPAVASFTDYVACLVRQHECEVAELLRFESPRAAALLGQVGHTLVDGICPEP